MEYNDLTSYSRTRKLHNIHSNLCSWFVTSKNKFCGNYCSRRSKKDLNLRYCWRHSSVFTNPEDVLVVAMIVSDDRIFNRDVWKCFIQRCQTDRVPIHLIIYHELMNKGTVREGENLISRFRPLPSRFGQRCISLVNAHGGTRYMSVYLQILRYVCDIPNATKCIVITERTIPIRTPMETFSLACKLNKCHIDVSYNVAFSEKIPSTVVSLGARNKPFPAANNMAQGLFTTEFLRQALPAVPLHCDKFGLKFSDGVYSVSDSELYESWRNYTGSNIDEFLLVNSFLLNQQTNKAISLLKRYMEPTIENDKYTVAEVPIWRNRVKRTHIFNSLKGPVKVLWLDARARNYYKHLENPVTLKRILKYLVVTKRRALFFRSVQLI